MLKIDPAVLEGADIPATWTEPDADGVSFLVTFATVKERQDGLFTEDGDPRPSEEQVAFWLGRVSDWKGLPSEFSLDRLRRLCDLDMSYQNRIVQAVQSLASFCGQPEPVEAEIAP